MFQYYSNIALGPCEQERKRANIYSTKNASNIERALNIGIIILHIQVISWPEIGILLLFVQMHKHVLCDFFSDRFCFVVFSMLHTTTCIIWCCPCPSTWLAVFALRIVFLNVFCCIPYYDVCAGTACYLIQCTNV